MFFKIPGWGAPTPLTSLVEYHSLSHGHLLLFKCKVTCNFAEESKATDNHVSALD